MSGRFAWARWGRCFAGMLAVAVSVHCSLLALGAALPPADTLCSTICLCAYFCWRHEVLKRMHDPDDRVLAGKCFILKTMMFKTKQLF